MVSADKNLLARRYPVNYSFDNIGWQDGDNRAAGGNGNVGGAASVSGSANAVTAGWPTQGKGIEDNPFIISNTTDWNDFADYVNSGYAFSVRRRRPDADLHQRHVRRAIRRRILRPVPPREERHD